MKPIQLPLSSRWMKLLAVILVAVWTPAIHAAYWNKNLTQTQSQRRDLDGDGIPNVVDPDTDNDGIPNTLDKNADGGIAKTGPYAGQYLGDHSDNDSPSEEDIDDDGLSDDSLAEKDIDGDGKLNAAFNEDDIDGDGVMNDDSADTDEDGDGLADLDDDDDNNNGLRDIDDSYHHPEEGEHEFKVNRSNGAAPLDFPSAGQLIALVQGATSYFSGQLPSSATP